MLDYTIELISLAASNSLAVFCVCNLIIAVLLVGGSRPIPRPDEIKCTNDFSETVDNENLKENSVSSCDQKSNDGLIVTVEEKVSSVSIDMVEDEEEIRYDDEENYDDDDDDELRKKVEEFIEKINRGWRDEKMRTYCSLSQ